MIKKADQENGEQKIRKAIEIIASLGIPRQQQNERSALTLLALLNLKPADRWQEAGNPCCNCYGNFNNEITKQ